MIITIEKNISNKKLIDIENYFKKFNIELKKIDENKYLCSGENYKIDEQSVKSLHGVVNLIRLSKPYHLVTREYQKEDTIVNVKGVLIGAFKQVIIAGPCSVENEKQVEIISQGVKEAGVSIFRGGAYKPRTSVYYFQGLGSLGLDYLQKSCLPVVSEITSVLQIDEFIKKVDILQVGARNMQNFELLKELGKINKPILLKRGASNTIDEWLMSAEYILKGGNKNVILCERGIRTFEKKTRYTLDLAVIKIIKSISHLPIIIDPSHASGDFELVPNQVLAAIAASCDGVMLEVHNNPSASLSDGYQSLKLSKLKELVEKARIVSNAIGRDI